MFLTMYPGALARDVTPRRGRRTGQDKACLRIVRGKETVSSSTGLEHRRGAKSSCLISRAIDDRDWVLVPKPANELCGRTYGK